MRELTRFLQARNESHRTNVMTFDECVYTTYTYDLVDAARGAASPHYQSHGHGHGHGHSQHGTSSSSAADKSKDRRSSQSANAKTGDLLGIPELNEDGGSPLEGESAQGGKLDQSQGDANKASTTDEGSHNNGNGNGNGNGGLSSSATLVDDEDEADEARRLEKQRQRREEAKRERRERFTVKGAIPEVFFMDYGTVVIWGMTLQEEKRLLREIRKFEVEKLAPEDVESEELNWYLADYSR